MSHQYPKNWSTDAIDKYITKESQEKGREAFQKTHIPINRIKVEQNKVFDDFVDNSNKYVDERAVFDGITASKLTDPNRLFFVIGESGSGKSELCQWLDYELQDYSDDGGIHEPILIPRHVREPREVLGLLTEELEGYDLESAKYLSNLPPSGIYKETFGKIINRFDRTQQATVDFLNSESFENKVRSQLDHYLESFDNPDESLTFEPISYENLEKLLEKSPSVKREHNSREDSTKYLYEEIKTGATEALKGMLFSGDIKEILKDVGKTYKERGQRPVLIIEDLTGFTIYDHQVLSFFSSISSANFDVVIGVTTGPYNNLVERQRADMASQDTIDDRIQARLRLTEEADDGRGSKTLFLEQPDIHIKLVQKYLQAIKDESATEFESLPDGITPSDLDEAFGENLYPFNEAFLTRIYQNLQEKNVPKQTPRVYLTFVIEELLNNKNPPFVQVELLQQRLGVIENPISSEYDGDDADVLKWYGSELNSEYRVDPRIPKTFGLESEGKAPIVDSEGDLCPECGTILTRPTDDTCPNSQCEWEREDDGETKTDIYEDNLNELLAWRRGETDLSTTSNLEDGVERTIQFFSDTPHTLVHEACSSNEAAYFRWEKGGRKVPVHIDNGNEPDYTKITVTPELPERLLTDLLKIGVWDETDLSKLQQQDRIELHTLREWADETISAHRDQLEKDIIESFGPSVDEMALFGKYLLNVFTGTSTEFTADALAKRVETANIQTIYATTDFDGDIKRLEENAELLKKLFHARFHLRKNIVNYDRLQDQVNSVDSRSNLLGKFQSHKKGHRGFKIGEKAKTSTDLKSFLTSQGFNLKGFARDLEEYKSKFQTDLEESRQEVHSLFDQVAGIEDLSTDDWNDLVDAYEREFVGKPVPESIGKLQSLNQKKLAEVVDILEEIDEGFENCSTVWEFFILHQEHYRLKYQNSEPNIYKQLGRFASDLDTIESLLKTKIDEFRKETFDPDKSQFNETVFAAEEASAAAEELL